MKPCLQMQSNANVSKFRKWSACKVAAAVLLTFQMLISQSSAAANFALTCYLDKKPQTCPSNEKHLCSVDLDGTMSGCVYSSACIEGDDKKDLTCDNDPSAKKHNCCCEANHCNNMRNAKVRKIFCTMFPKTAICSEYTDNVCLDENNMEESCKNGQSVCKSTRDESDLKPVGCADKIECPVDEGEEVTCQSDKCCCNAKTKPCNDKNSVAMQDAMKMVAFSKGFLMRASLILVILVTCMSISFSI